jgi:hypothetical protein
MPLYVDEIAIHNPISCAGPRIANRNLGKNDLWGRPWTMWMLYSEARLKKEPGLKIVEPQR